MKSIFKTMACIACIYILAIAAVHFYCHFASPKVGDVFYLIMFIYATATLCFYVFEFVKSRFVNIIYYPVYLVFGCLYYIYYLF